ncbi:hypothetical protein [Polyangium sp. 15x6]|uniref:hypothetical protein n=1 Tax=Polyangium sp. 15x6 TaxID=3042687 RepID=UPI00249A51CC|nr:hypothetical protein [Polyangium sp. 15x6]MDI3289054.1 hypothetical protein [Polyangium sp. 15x6]
MIKEDGKELGRGDGRDSWHVTPMPPDACATLETKIPKRDLTPLANAYLDDRPSEHCRASTVTHRKVPATFVHEVLPKGHRYYESGTLERTRTPPYRLCRGVTQVRLVLPAEIAPSQDLGLLFAQCNGLCHATRWHNPNGAEVECHEGGQLAAYQLGNHLYVIDDEHVRQVPLPCGVELDFQMTGFVAQLGLTKDDIREQ